MNFLGHSWQCPSPMDFLALFRPSMKNREGIGKADGPPFISIKILPLLKRGIPSYFQTCTSKHQVQPYKLLHSMQLLLKKKKKT